MIQIIKTVHHPEMSGWRFQLYVVGLNGLKCGSIEFMQYQGTRTPSFWLNLHGVTWIGRKFNFEYEGCTVLRCKTFEEAVKKINEVNASGKLKSRLTA